MRAEKVKNLFERCYSFLDSGQEFRVGHLINAQSRPLASSSVQTSLGSLVRCLLADDVVTHSSSHEK